MLKENFLDKEAKFSPSSTVYRGHTAIEKQQVVRFRSFNAARREQLQGIRQACQHQLTRLSVGQLPQLTR